MIIIDTNVLSEIMRMTPSSAIVKWLAEQTRSQVFITAISEAEIYYGIELLPAGKRRAALHSAAEAIFADDFAQRILPFDSGAARAFSRIAAGRRFAGKPIGQSDAQIAAIVQVHQATLATRNATDFENCDIRVLNPWRT